MPDAFIRVPSPPSPAALTRRCQAGLRLLLATVWITHLSAISAASQEPDHPEIFICNSYHSGFWWSDAEMRGILDGLRERWPKLMPHVEFLDHKRHPEPRYQDRFGAFIGDKYKGRKWDLVIAVDSPALRLVQRFPEWVGAAPVIFCGVGRLETPTNSPISQIAGVMEIPDANGTLQLLRQLLPETTDVYVLGDSPVIRFDQLSREHPALQFHQVRAPDPASLLKQVAQLPPRSAILDIGGLATIGELLTGPEFKRLVAQEASVPLMKQYDIPGNRWGLGGRVIEGERHGRLAARLALRVLDGEPVAGIPVQVDETRRTMVDHAEMIRFGIPFSRLPPDTVVINRPPPLHQRYRTAIFVLGGFVTGLAVLSAFLFRAQRRRRMLFDHASDAIMILGRDGMIREANAAAARMFGRPKTALVGQRPDQLLASQVDQKPLAVGDLVPGETIGERRIFARADGTTFVGDCHISGFPHHGIQAIIRDVSDRELAEARLRESETRFRLAAEAVQEVIYEWTPGTDEVVRSPGMFSVTGYTPEECVAKGSWWRDLIHPDDERRIRRELTGALQSSAAEYSLEYRIRHREGKYREVWDRGKILRNEQGAPIKCIGASADISQLRSLEAQLRQAQKMEAIGTLAGGIAHDFNNILSGIVGNAGLAKLANDNGRPAEGYVEDILAASLRARDLVQQILTFSHQQESDRQDLDLLPTLLEVTRFLRSTIPAAIEVETDWPETLPTVFADSTQVYQSVLNLATNSAHAIGEQRGVITLAARVCEFHKPQDLPAEGLQPGRFVAIQVQDDGPGMPPEVRERVFEPFFTTKDIGRGSGLGLSMVHGIVRGHDGAITVDTAPGQGTCFTMYFPVTEAPAVEPTPPVNADLTPGDGQHVLLVDDEPVVRKTISNMITALNYRVTIEENPQAALDSLRAAKGDYDLLLTDLSMPGWSGLELREQVARDRPELPVVLMTGHLQDQAVDDYEQMGFRGVLQKPVTLESLATEIASALADRSPGTANQ